MSGLPSPSRVPCGTCPYRRDVPAGIWDASEYRKLLLYDGGTIDQLMAGGTALFFCHQNDGHLCAGWAGCHNTDELLAVRINAVDPSTFGYVSPIPLFSSGAEAAAHGLSEIDQPGQRAMVAVAKLRKRRGR
jgi:hypothetical protein